MTILTPPEEAEKMMEDSGPDPAFAAAPPDTNLILAAPMLYEAVEDAVEGFALLRIGMLHDRAALKMIDAHLDELRYALSKAGGQ